MTKRGFHKGSPKWVSFSDKYYQRCKDKYRKLAMFLHVLRGKRTAQDRINRYNKSHRSTDQQEAHDTRIIHITARRFGLTEGQQFPLAAIILMADKGVTKAKEQYNKLAQAAEFNNISVRQAYDHFVLGKELNVPT